MTEINVTIHYKGWVRHCTLSEAKGAGAETNTRWHLMEKGYYRGTLLWSVERSLWFTSNQWTGEEESICEELERYVINWYG